MNRAKKQKGQTRLCIDRSGWQHIQSVGTSRALKQKQLWLTKQRNVQSCYGSGELLRSAEHYLEKICINITDGVQS